MNTVKKTKRIQLAAIVLKNAFQTSCSEFSHVVLVQHLSFFSSGPIANSYVPTTVHGGGSKNALAKKLWKP